MDRLIEDEKRRRRKESKIKRNLEEEEVYLGEVSLTDIGLEHNGLQEVP